MNSPTMVSCEISARSDLKPACRKFSCWQEAEFSETPGAKARPVQHTQRSRSVREISTFAHLPARHARRPFHQYTRRLPAPDARIRRSRRRCQLRQSGRREPDLSSYWSGVYARPWLARRALIPARWETELAARPIPAWWADEREDVQNERSRTERPK